MYIYNYILYISQVVQNFFHQLHFLGYPNFCWFNWKKPLSELCFGRRKSPKVTLKYPHLEFWVPWNITQLFRKKIQLKHPSIKLTSGIKNNRFPQENPHPRIPHQLAPTEASKTTLLKASQSSTRWGNTRSYRWIPLDSYWEVKR